MKWNEYRTGLGRGLPVGMGYLSVSFGFGILAASLGISPLEALSRGCSLLVSRGAGICELLNLEEMDIIENPLDTEELKSKLLWIHHHPNHSRLALPKRSWADAVAELARLCEGGRP